MIKPEILDSLFSSRNDAKICGVLLDFGQQTAGEIVRNTGIHRRNVYDSLDRLIKTGYVSSINENKKQYFGIANVGLIIESLKTKRKEIDEGIPQIMKGAERAEKPEIQFWTGANAFKYMLEDELRTDDEIFAISTTHFEDKIWDYYEKHYSKMLSGKNRLKILFVERDRNLGKKAEKYNWVEAGYLPDSYLSEVGVEIYRDGVCLILPDIIINIKSKEISGRMRSFFDMLWETAKKSRKR